MRAREEISSDGDDGWDSWRNVSETGRLARVFSREERGMEERVVKVWEEARAGEGADTRKSRVAEMGKREAKRREEKRREETRREEKRQRLAGDTGTSIIHVVCLLHLLPPFVVFHDLRSL